MIDDFVAVARAELEETGTAVAQDVIVVGAAALFSGKHVLLNSGSAELRRSVSRAFISAAVATGLSAGHVEVHLNSARIQSAGGGSGLFDDASAARLWLLISDVDLWHFGSTALARKIAASRLTDPDLRTLATAAGIRRRPLDRGWQTIQNAFAWVEVVAS